MAYSVNATCLSEGVYRLAYGKGSLKLATQVYHDDTQKLWISQDGHIEPQKLFRDAKDLWGQWASQHYGSPDAGQAAEAGPGDVRVPGATPLASKSTPVVLEGMPEPDATKGVKLIDGIIHRFYPPPAGALVGDWNWVGTDGLNSAERRTNSNYSFSEDKLSAQTGT